MSKLKKNVISTAVAVIGSTALPASAALVSMSSSVNLNEILSGNNTSVQFNINSLLSNQGYNASNVVSGNLVVYGVSEANYGASTNEPYSDYAVTDTTTRTASYTLPGYYSSGYTSCSGWGYCYYSPGTYYPGYTSYYNVTDTTQTRSRDISNVDNVADTMQVTAGGATALATANQTLSTADPYGTPTLDYTTGSESSGYVYYYSQERDTYEAILGPLEAFLGLNLFALEDIWADGILDVGIASTIGSFNLTSAKLSFEVETSPVPLPPSLGLFGIGLAALASRRRKKAEPET